MHAYRRLWVRLPGLILLSTIIPFSEFNDAACVLALPLLRTPSLDDRPLVRLPTRWLACGRVGLDRFRDLTHWVTLMSFKGNHPYSLLPDLSRHDQCFRVRGPHLVFRLARDKTESSFAFMAMPVKRADSVE